MLGKVLDNKYRLTGLLGSGGMGSVYEAEILSGGRAAVKLLNVERPADVVLSRFGREARAAGAIASEHITRFLDAGTDPETGCAYLAMEHLRGEDAQNLMRKLGPLPVDLALRIVGQALTGLAEAHAARIVHRDIKPANLFIAEDGERLTVKLLDFGIAKIRHDEGDTSETAGLTQTGSMLGSPLYMSPEQARSVKHVDHRSDLWSMGVVLYQALTGRTPFQHIDGIGPLLMAICSEAPPPVTSFAPWVPPNVVEVVDRALQQRTSDRFQSAEAMLNAVRSLTGGDLSLTRAMVRPISEDERAKVAVAVTHNQDPLAPTIAHEESAKLTTESPVTARSSATATTESAAAKRSSPWPLAAAVILAAAIGGGAVFLIRPSSSSGAGAPSAPSSAPVAIETTPQPPPVAPPIESASAPVVTPAPPPSASASASASAISADRKPVAPIKDIAKPKHPVAAPAPSAPKDPLPVDHRSYGDRK